jgi:hypothetical protein
MIKSPITKTGDIRYFEFVKIFILISFSIGFLSQYMSRQVVSHQMNVIYTYILIVLVVFEVLKSIYVISRELIELIVSFKIAWITIPKIRLHVIINSFKNNAHTILVVNTRIQYCVVRC